MANFHELSEHYLKEVEYYLSLSQTLLNKGNKGGNLTGSLKVSGDYIENLVKTILKRFIPNSFRVVSGYIATPELMNNGSDLPQFDIIIIDNKVAPILTMRDTDIEVNPIEGVCGIIEVKRTINVKSMKESINQVQKANGIGLLKDQTEQMLNPLFGIISMQSTIECTQMVELIREYNSLVDFVWSFDGKAIIPLLNKSKEDILGYMPISRNCSIDRYNHNGYLGTFMAWESSEEKLQIFRKVIGFISLFLNLTGPRNRSHGTIFQYYFKNDNKIHSKFIIEE